jgi:hypothetical protein
MKLAPRWYGPFKVAARISGVAYRLELPETWKIHNIFHASLLTPYKETEKHGPNFLEPPPELVEGEPEWEVEQILGDWTYWRKKQFLIRWKGYALVHDSWVDESDLHAPKLLTDYKHQTVSKVLSQLKKNQSADQSAYKSAAQSLKTKRQRKTHIRSVKWGDKETSSPLPILLRTTTITTQSMNSHPQTPDNDGISYYSPAVDDTLPLPEPGHTRPVSPDHISIRSSDSDKENEEHPYSPEGLAFTWTYVRAAVKHWRECYAPRTCDCHMDL